MSGMLIFAEVYQAEVKNISNRNYFQPVLNAINNSRESILMGMYIVSLSAKEGDSCVKQLLQALVDAKNRGVTVKVILEYHRLEDFMPGGLRYNAYQYLKKNGINVFFDESSSNCLHLKTIVIDKEIVITGSSNWSEAAFKASYETNLFVRSKSLALEVIKELDAIPLREEPRKVIADSFDIPNSFCDSKFGSLKRMVTTNDLRSLDLVLILWNENSTPLPIPRGERVFLCRDIAERLGLLQKMDEIGWRRQIKKSLRKLEERYKLIKYEWQFGKDEIRVEFLSYSDAVIKFPKDYFKYGWNTRLSPAGKAVLITMYAELGGLTDSVLSLPLLYLSKKYGMNDHEYSEGMQELKRLNIVKVQYSEGFENREDTKINILGVYDMDDYDNKIEGLRLQYGKDLVDKAVELAGIVYNAYDVHVVEDVIENMNMYGVNAVMEAFDYVQSMTVDNPKRTYNYVFGILRKRPVMSAPHLNTTSLRYED
jgi:hypothetical protein